MQKHRPCKNYMLQVYMPLIIHSSSRTMFGTESGTSHKAEACVAGMEIF